VDHEILEEFKRQRLEEMKQLAKAQKFGYLKQISKPEFEKEVTEASNQQVVLCCLFKYAQEESKLLLARLEELAQKKKECKFVKIVGNECIPNYPDENCPTLLIYKDSNPIGHIRGLANIGGKAQCTADVIEWELTQLGVWKTDLEENPRKFKMLRGKEVQDKKAKHDDDDEEDLDEEEEQDAKPPDNVDDESDSLDLD